MTKPKNRKRKTVSATSTSPSISDSKRRPGISNMDNDDFTAKIRNSLQNKDVKLAFRDIMAEALQQHIDRLEAKSIEQEKRIDALEENLLKTTQEKNEVENELKQLLQYTRRNALRISNPAWKEPVRLPGQSAEENTDALVLQLASVLQVELHPWEIGRSHRVGKPKSDGSPRPILVKFISYNVRRRIYEARKKLKTSKNPSLKKVYINEDLTKENSKLAYEARQLRTQKRVVDTFTRDGRIYVKCNAGDTPVVARDSQHLQHIVQSASFADTVSKRQTRHDANPRNGPRPASDSGDTTSESLSMLPTMPAVPIVPFQGPPVNLHGVLSSTPMHVEDALTSTSKCPDEPTGSTGGEDLHLEYDPYSCETEEDSAYMCPEEPNGDGTGVEDETDS